MPLQTFYKSFTLVTSEKLEGVADAPYLYFFTKSIVVMHIYSLVFLLLQFSFASDQALESSQPSAVADNEQKLTGKKPVAVNIVFKYTDGGETWQDISEGLPENLQAESVQRDGFFANDNGLYLRAGNELYHSTPTSEGPFWKEEMFPGRQGSIAPSKTGMFAYNYYDGQFLQKVNGKSMWWPVYTNFPEKAIRTVFETAGGTLFIGSDNGLFKSTNSGKTWKQVYTGGWVMKLAEANGALLATSQEGIIRSTDDGENWESVLNEGGVGIAVERIQGGFAAIVYNTQLAARTVRASYDGGETWQPIDTGLIPQLSVASIVEVGEYFFCGHPAGIFRSSDKGQTWKLLLPSIEDKVFNLAVSGSAIYAVPRSGGC